MEEVLERGRCRGEGERHSSRKNEQKGKGTALGRGSVPPRVMGKWVSTWAKWWAGLLGSGPNWIGLPGFFSLFFFVVY